MHSNTRTTAELEPTGGGEATASALRVGSRKSRIVTTTAADLCDASVRRQVIASAIRIVRAVRRVAHGAPIVVKVCNVSSALRAVGVAFRQEGEADTGGRRARPHGLADVSHLTHAAK